MISRNGVQPFTASYAYDINSNRIQKVETITDVTETINYTYNANDQLLSEISSVNGTTLYQYDANGSLTTKENTGKFSYHYGYDLRSRLALATITRKEGLNDVTITSSYAYNADGIRTRALQTINGITQDRYFLLDRGHTGYAQVFEETSTLGGNVVRSYVLGDDILSQDVAGITSHLLYDGHGSTRQLADTTGVIMANYKYDAYGKMLGGDPNVTDQQSATDLLYAGEQFDAGLQMEYLRARYYDQNTGRFNRLDPFDGNSDDPQSLHKYAYVHCDPVNGLDPRGEMAITMDMFSAMMIMVSLSALLILHVSDLRQRITTTSIGWEIKAEIEFLNAMGRDFQAMLFAETIMSMISAGQIAKDILVSDTIPKTKVDEKDRPIPWVIPIPKIETQRRRPKTRIYVHHSYARYQASFAQGLRPSSYATNIIYPTGWAAKWYLALPHVVPPDAAYSVTLIEPETHTWESVVPPMVDYAGALMPGGGYQYYFELGTRPGSVWGPVQSLPPGDPPGELTYPSKAP